MNEKEEKKLIEEYLNSKQQIRRANAETTQDNGGSASPLPDIPTDLPTATAGETGNYVKV